MNVLTLLDQQVVAGSTWRTSIGGTHGGLTQRCSYLSSNHTIRTVRECSKYELHTVRECSEYELHTARTVLSYPIQLNAA